MLEVSKLCDRKRRGLLINPAIRKGVDLMKQGLHTSPNDVKSTIYGADVETVSELKDMRLADLDNVWKNLTFIDRQDILEDIGIDKKHAKKGWNKLMSALSEDDKISIRNALRDFWSWKFEAAEEHYGVPPVVLALIPIVLPILIKMGSKGIDKMGCNVY